MSWTQEYRSETAFWVALRRQANHAAATGRTPSHELIRTFVMQRFMARMFENPTAPWIVAGGTGLLIRVPGSRGTRDIDLNTTSANYGTLDTIRADLTALTADNPSLDPFTFELDDTAATFTGGLLGSSWRITATIAGQRAAVFGLDLAADDTVLATDVERHTVTPAIPDIRGLPPPPPVPLIPLESQLADKIASVSFRDDRGRSTNRYRDLVDLAIYAGHVDVDADKLRQALQRRSAARNRPVPKKIELPADWAAGYRKTATATNLPTPLHDVDAATDTVTAWLNPLLDNTIPAAAVWDHHAGTWRTADHAPTKPGHVWVRPHTRDGQPIIDHYRRRPRTATG